MDTPAERHCKNCGNPINSGAKLFCSWKCYQAMNKGETSPKYKNGHVRVDGYRLLGIDGRDVLEHRYVMEQHIGRPLLQKEVVHHKDGNKLNNSIDNLELFNSQSSHVNAHCIGFRNEAEKQCCRCKVIKPRTEFYPSSMPGRDPNRPKCKVCSAPPKTRISGWTKHGRCANCGTVDRAHASRGLCTSCHGNLWQKAKRGTLTPREQEIRNALGFSNETANLLTPGK